MPLTENLHQSETKGEIEFPNIPCRTIMQNNNAAPGSGFYEQILLIYGGKILPI